MGKSSSAPKPDPQVGEAAKMQAELGQEWLGFAQEQFDVANERQEGLDALTKQIQERQLATADRSDQWSQEDRASSQQDREWALNQREKLTGQSEADRNWATEQRDKFTEQSEQDREWATGQRDKLSGVGDDLYGRADSIRGEADRYRGWAQEDRSFARNLRDDYDKFKPVNEKIVSDSMSWDSDARLDDQAAQARAGVMANSDMARQQQQRQMTSMGVNPNSGRFQGADRATTQQAALASAGAQNVARDNARQQAVGMRQNAASLGQNVLGQSQQATGMANSTAGLANQTDSLANSTTALGMQADSQAQGAAGYGSSVGSNNAGMGAAGYGSSVGSNSAGMGAAGFAAGQYNAGLGAAGLGLNAAGSALSGQQSTNQMSNSNSSIMGQGYQGAMQGYNNQAGILNQQYGNQLQAWSANQQASAQGAAGLMQGLGTLGGAAIMMSSKDAKENKRPIKGSALEAVKGLPVEAWKYKKGVADEGEHIGPYAEDFKKQTGKGDGKTIPVQDMMGLQLKAIQELGLRIDNLEGGGKKKGGRRPVTIDGEYEERMA